MQRILDEPSTHPTPRRAGRRPHRPAGRGRHRHGAMAIGALALFLAALALSVTGILAQTEEPQAIDAARSLVTSDEAPWNLVLVNASHPLPDNFTVQTAEVSGGERVDTRILQPLDEMFTAAEAAGYAPFVRSGFRTRAQQEQILTERIAQYQGEGMSAEAAEREARAWVAAPGTSEHELGLAVDINDEDGNEGLYGWLAEHAHEYGFILRYPPEKSAVTGIAHEPWHYRYVGVEAATEIWQQGTTLEEYLGQN